MVIPDLEPLKLEDGKAATVLTLNESMCKYPIGDPTDADFAFCGRGVSAVIRTARTTRVSPISRAKREKRRTPGEPDELRRMLRLAAM